MTENYIQHIHEITNKIKVLRLKLPDVSAEDIGELGESLKEIDFSEVNNDLIEDLQKAFNQLSDEVTQTMHQLDQYCNEMQNNVARIESQVKAVKAYDKTQQIK